MLVFLFIVNTIISITQAVYPDKMVKIINKKVTVFTLCLISLLSTHAYANETVWSNDSWTPKPIDWCYEIIGSENGYTVYEEVEEKFNNKFITQYGLKNSTFCRLELTLGVTSNVMRCSCIEG